MTAALVSLASAFSTYDPNASATASASTEPFDAKIDTEDYFNILTIDGGGIRGLIPAMVL